jgi:hypothetical protein
MILIQSELIKAAIILHIWRNCRLSRRLARFTIRVIAESGLLYTLTSVAAFGAVFISTEAFTIGSAIVCHQ